MNTLHLLHLLHFLHPLHFHRAAIFLSVLFTLSGLALPASAAQQAPIESLAQLRQHLAAEPDARSPLDQLSRGSKNRFLQSLTFNEKGLTGFYYDDLRTELGPAGIRQILALFGRQHLARAIARSAFKRIESHPSIAIADGIDNEYDDDDDEICADCAPWDWPDIFDDLSGGSSGEDHFRYRCIAPGTCKLKPGYICLSTC